MSYFHLSTPIDDQLLVVMTSPSSGVERPSIPTKAPEISYFQYQSLVLATASTILLAFAFTSWKATRTNPKKISLTSFSQAIALSALVALIAIEGYMIIISDKNEIIPLCSYSIMIAIAILASFNILTTHGNYIPTIVVMFGAVMGSLEAVEIMRHRPLNLAQYILTAVLFAPLAIGLVQSNPRAKQIDGRLSIDDTPFLDRIKFGWLSSLFDAVGARRLSEDDIGSLQGAWGTQNITDVSYTFWPKGRRLKVSMLARQHHKYLLFASLLQAIASATEYLTPWLLRALINNPNVFAFSKMFGFIILGTIVRSHAQYYFMVVGMRMKATVIARVYEKVSGIDSAFVSMGNVGTLVEVDSQRFITTMPWLYNVWTLPIQIVICIASLVSILGVGCLAGIVIILALLTALFFITAHYIQYWLTRRMEQTELRSSLVVEMLDNIKSIKLQGWESIIQGKLEKVRSSEIDMLGYRATFNSLSASFMVCSTGILMAAALIASVLAKGSVSAGEIFPSLMFLTLLRDPMAMGSVMMAEVKALSVSLKRINAFLRLPDRPTSTSYTSTTSEMSKYLEVSSATFSAFAYTDEPIGAILSGVDLSVRSGNLVTIVGEVGAGKTSLLLGILGDLGLDCGSVKLSGSVAYMPQSGWTIHATIRENIIFGRPFDSVRYGEVIRSCGLQQDFKIWKEGDQMIVSQKGSNLSGGQKSRISIARAVYANADIYILDDPLAALDAHVEDLIIKEVLGRQGMLKDKARLMVTNSMKTISVADSVSLVGNGTLTQGSNWSNISDSGHSDLKTYLSTLASSNSRGTGAKEAIQATKTSISLHASHSAISTDSQYQETESEAGLVVSNATQLPEYQQSMRSLPAMSNEDMPVEELQKSPLQDQSVKNGISPAVYKAWIQSLSVRGFGISCIFLACYQVLGFSTTYSLKILATLSSEEGERQGTALQILSATLVLSILQALAMFVFLFCFYKLCILPAARTIHNQLVGSILKSKLSFFDITSRGDITTRFMNDIARLDSSLSNTMAHLCFMTPQLVLTLCIISVIAPTTIILIIPMAYLYFRIQSYFLNLSRQLKRLENSTRGPITDNFQEMVSGSLVIRTAGMAQVFAQRCFEAVDRQAAVTLPSFSVDGWLSIRLDLMGVVLQVASTGFLLLGGTSAGTLGFAMTYILALPTLFGKFVQMRGVFESDTVSLERLLSYEDNDVDGVLPDDKISLQTEIETGWPTEGSIQFRNFGTRYAPNLPLSLQQITLDIKAGERIGVVGRTGSGKTTLAMSLLRVSEAAEGVIMVDGVDISTVNVQELRSKFAIIPQACPTFQGTIRQNLDPLGKHSDLQLCRVLGETSLNVGNKITSQSLLDTQMVADGSNISGGQLQLLAIARAMLSDSKIVILDEVTAAIDPQTDDKIQKTMQKAFDGRTIITVAHRIPTVLRSDRIIVLDQGRIVECGSPKELLINQSSSVFAGMVKQAGLYQGAVELVMSRKD